MLLYVYGVQTYILQENSPLSAAGATRATMWHASSAISLTTKHLWEVHLQAPLQEIHHGREKDVRLCLADFEYCKRMLSLGCHIQWQQHCAVHTTSLRVGNAEVNALVIGLHIVAKFRLHAT